VSFGSPGRRESVTIDRICFFSSARGANSSARYSPTLQAAIGLCWLPSELASLPGALFTIRLQGGAGLAEARVHHGPFYDPEGERLRM